MLFALRPCLGLLPGFWLLLIRLHLVVALEEWCRVLCMCLSLCCWTELCIGMVWLECCFGVGCCSCCCSLGLCFCLDLGLDFGSVLWLWLCC